VLHASHTTGIQTCWGWQWTSQAAAMTILQFTNEHSSVVSTLPWGVMYALLQSRLCGGGANQVGCMLGSTSATHVALRIGVVAWTWVICIRRYTVTHSLSHCHTFKLSNTAFAKCAPYLVRVEAPHTLGESLQQF